MNCGQVAIAMTDRDAVEPDQYYFRAGRQECTIEGGYFHGAPHFVAEVLSPATRWLDRGPRREVFRRAGVPQLWLLEALFEQVELYELAGLDYQRIATYGASDTFNVPGIPETIVNVTELFETQWKRHQRRSGKTGDDAPRACWPSVPTKRLARAWSTFSKTSAAGSKCRSPGRRPWTQARTWWRSAASG